MAPSRTASTGSTSGGPTYRKGPRRALDDVEFATRTYVYWFRRRFHGEISVNASYTTAPKPTTAVKERQPPESSLNTHSSHATRGGSTSGGVAGTLLRLATSTPALDTQNGTT